ncbi:Sialidase [Kockovaella imperatae]|uniref:Sialidase n=1 Tax=Kockovaella imperatae TaxID=4999 RepID=A0A1Y1UNE8_9TREE|nr:Sialidase [Kockovaella imperatae]ORX39590.1 Sialidase [Kockovaella imperatae]
MIHLVALSLTSVALAAPTTGATPWGYFTNNTIMTTSGNASVSYPRFTELQNGSILATTAYRGPQPPYFPIFRSDDGGASWEHVSDLRDQVEGVGFTAQPAITHLTFPLGGYPEGTILAGGNIFGLNFTRIDLYASTDGARTWEFVSHVAEGGRANTTNGATPVWEPKFLPWNNSVIAYYSDQRNPEHGQQLSHQVSYDLKTWGPVVTDVALEPYDARPGMTNIAHVQSVNKWILVHETPIGNSSSYGVNYPVHYKLADTPVDFGPSPDIPLVVNNKTAPNASPYVVWSKDGGPLGTIIVSDADNTGVFTNTAGGDPDKWELHGTPAGAVYSRAVEILRCLPNHLLIYGGDTYDGAMEGAHEPFSVTSVNLEEVLAAPEYSFP